MPVWLVRDLCLSLAPVRLRAAQQDVGILLHKRRSPRNPSCCRRQPRPVLAKSIQSCHGDGAQAAAPETSDAFLPKWSQGWGLPTECVDTSHSPRVLPAATTSSAPDTPATPGLAPGPPRRLAALLFREQCVWFVALSKLSTICNTRNSSAITTETAGVHRGPLAGQQSMNYTHWAAKGDVASRAVAHRAAHCSR
jgi:predicted CxxxxCH...CXXCH cytochrome family protein